MRPQPRTPTFCISTSLPPVLSRRAPGAYMSLIGVEDRGGVRHIVLQRAEKRNAFNGELIQALGGAVEDAAADDDVRVVVLRGDEPSVSSGVDLEDVRDL